MTNAEIEIAVRELAHTWADELGLEYSGVQLPDLMEYNFLTVINRLMLQHIAQQNAPSEPPPVEGAHA